MKTTIQHILDTSIDCLLSRMEANGDDYPFIDTKFDIVTHRNFDSSDAAFKQRTCIYSWIQGRGLESLAKHAGYYEAIGRTDLSARIDRQLSRVVPAMEALRRRNSGRLPFAMNPDGESFFSMSPSPANFSDLFYSKGLYAAAKRLEDFALQKEARTLFCQVIEAIRAGRFITDQQSFDPKNAVQFIPGKYPQGPRMISLGGLADFAQDDGDDSKTAATADEFITYILDHHVQDGSIAPLQPLDFVESLDEHQCIWRDGQVIFSDPGHALEFTGLAARCLTTLTPQRHPALFQRCEEILPPLFCHVFDSGFNATAGGICKGYDLASHTVLNSDMPWWNLPEATRAGVLLQRLFPQTAGDAVARRTQAAFQAFTDGFLQSNGFGCQTRSADGQIIPVIPAVPDADPGYHTNLSLMDCL